MWQDYKSFCREVFHAGKPIAVIFVFYAMAVSVFVGLTNGGGVPGIFHVFAASMVIALVPTIAMCALLTVTFFLYRLLRAPNDSSR